MYQKIFISLNAAMLLSLASCAEGTAAPQRNKVLSSYNTNVVLTGGVVTTLNASNDITDALAFDENGTVIAVGTAQDVIAAAGKGATLIDLDGAQVLPGFQDVHLHAVEAGLNENRCFLSEFGSIARYKSEILECAETQLSSPWFIGAGVSMPDILELTARPAAFLDDHKPGKTAGS